jgi:hypothetical protein
MLLEDLLRDDIRLFTKACASADKPAESIPVVAAEKDFLDEDDEYRSLSSFAAGNKGSSRSNSKVGGGRDSNSQSRSNAQVGRGGRESGRGSSSFEVKSFAEIMQEKRRKQQQEKEAKRPSTAGGEAKRRRT